MKFNYSKNQVYSDKFILVNYNDFNYRLIYLKSSRNKGFEINEKFENNKKVENNKIVLDNSNSVFASSLSRTKSKIRALALCNNFEYFFTFTINSSFDFRYDIDYCFKEIRKLFKSYLRKYKDFKYICILEKHKSGALHFHGLCKGLEDLYTNSNGYFSSHHFDKLGFNSFSKIKNYLKCCNYITKYITKDFVKNSHHQSYICSRGLLVPQRNEVKVIDNIDFQYFNDFVKILDFTADDKKIFDKFYINSWHYLLYMIYFFWEVVPPSKFLFYAKGGANLWIIMGSLNY